MGMGPRAHLAHPCADVCVQANETIIKRTLPPVPVAAPGGMEVLAQAALML